jgi:hypothetical protein
MRAQLGGVSTTARIYASTFSSRLFSRNQASVFRADTFSAMVLKKLDHRHLFFVGHLAGIVQQGIGDAQGVLGMVGVPRFGNK